MGIFNTFSVGIIVSIFYGISVTLLAQPGVLPPPATDVLSQYVEAGVDITDLKAQIEQGTTSQTDVPLLDLGALVFYSGNFLIDLLINVFFAIPQMIILLLDQLFTIINIDSFFTFNVKLFFQVIVGSFYLIGLIQLIINSRSGGQVVT